VYIPEHEFDLFQIKWDKRKSFDKQVALFYRKLELLRVVSDLVGHLKQIHSDHFTSFVETFNKTFKLYYEEFSGLLEKEDFRLTFFRVLEHEHFNPDRMYAFHYSENSKSSSSLTTWT
jgi:hypothetical protein